MIREAELFVMAENVLLEVVGRIRAEHRSIVIPPLFDRPGDDRPTPIRQVVQRYAFDNAWVPAMLSGKTMDEAGRAQFDGDLLGDDAHAAAARFSATACAAAADVTDGDAVVHAGAGDLTTSDYLLQITMARSFVAHDIAMHLGSRACPLTEELARGLWERTYPNAAAWRAQGIFREPLLPEPADVSWRDRFLMSAGRDPHALDH